MAAAFDHNVVHLSSVLVNHLPGVFIVVIPFFLKLNGRWVEGVIIPNSCYKDSGASFHSQYLEGVGVTSRFSLFLPLSPVSRFLLIDEFLFFVFIFKFVYLRQVIFLCIY